jgi:peptide-methionine (S)-S-oxide reductase
MAASGARAADGGWMPPKYAIPLAAAAVGFMVVGVMWQASAISPIARAVALPSPTLDEPVTAPVPGTPPGQEVAVFAGGCFWGVQVVFQHVAGVTSAVSGYAGGEGPQPTYDQVATGTTGYAEAVEVTFDPSVVSYGTLLQVFFSVAHDPTEVDRQGPDVGPQYRSEIFTTTKMQADVVTAYLAQLRNAEVYPAPIATKLADLTQFWRAENEHQDYATIHANDSYVVMNDLPKLVSLRDVFPDLWRDQPVLVNPGDD